jgi:hypothetical protein
VGQNYTIARSIKYLEEQFIPLAPPQDYAYAVPFTSTVAHDVFSPVYHVFLYVGRYANDENTIPVERGFASFDCTVPRVEYILVFTLLLLLCGRKLIRFLHHSSILQFKGGRHWQSFYKDYFHRYLLTSEILTISTEIYETLSNQAPPRQR